MHGQEGPVQESNPGPLAPEARIMPLDQQASHNNKMVTWDKQEMHNKFDVSEKKRAQWMSWKCFKFSFHEWQKKYLN